MRITVGQLKQIIAEETDRALSEAPEAPQAGLLKDVTAIGERLQALGNRGRGGLGALAGLGRDADAASKLESLVGELDAQLKALQGVVTSLKKEAWKAGAQQKLKTGAA